MKDGGPAFPVVGMQHINGQAVTGIFQSGMSLRDYFAAAALPACYAQGCGHCEHQGWPEN